jgi:predicted aldo/keto reductase-like oxidoreductase
MCNSCQHKPHIPAEVLSKLPADGKFLGFSKTKVIELVSETKTQEKWVVAIKWQWADKTNRQIRNALFNKDNGEYIEELP